MASTVVAMASTVVAMASNLRAMASTLVAMASNLIVMASNLIVMASNLMTARHRASLHVPVQRYNWRLWLQPEKKSKDLPWTVGKGTKAESRNDTCNV